MNIPLRRIISVLALVFLSVLHAHCQPLTPEEARAALSHAKKAAPVQNTVEPGTYRAIETTEINKTIIITTHYKLHRANATTLTRTETRTRQSNQSETEEGLQITLENDDGNWILFQKSALRAPFGDIANDMMNNTKKCSDLSQRKEALEKAMATDVTFSGERFQQDGRAQLRIRENYGPEAQKLFKKLMDETWNEAKREIPLAIRLVVAPILASKKSGLLPAARETIIDEEKHIIVSQIPLGKDGKPIDADGGQKPKQKKSPLKWERCDDLPPESCLVPANLKQERPDSIWGFFKALQKCIKEDIALAKQRKETAKTTAATQPTATSAASGKP